MKISLSGRDTLLRDNSTSVIVTRSGEALSKAGFDDNYVEFFNEGTVGLLNDCAEFIGEGTEIEYSLRKRLTKIEFRMLIPGESFDPFKNGSESAKRYVERLTDLNLNAGIPSISSKYVLG